jgi:L-iditol 2-dehydrogenase
MGPPAQEVEDTMTAVSIPKTMKASVLHGIKNIKVEDRDVPQPGEGEVLIKINAVGVCGSDTHYYLEGRIGDFVVDGPLILGHESSGTVVSVGAGVDEAKVGQRVAIEGGIPKPYSREVMGGFYNLDPDIAFHATPPYDGTLCDYVVMPQEFVFDLPDNVSDEAGALLEPLSVAIAANKAGQVGLGSHVLISGSGPIGLLVAAVARLSGATYVQVVDLREERLETALKYGAHVATRPEAVDRDDFDVFVDATGAPPAISAGIPHLRTAGRAVLVGMGADTIELPLPLLQVRGIEVISQFRYKNTWPTAVEIAAAGLVDLDGMVTSTFGLDGVAEALVVGGEPGQIKAVVKP